ncbi:MAG: hypothetical protein WC326_09375 [Candidatus Delongbacteria bacterium]
MAPWFRLRCGASLLVLLAGLAAATEPTPAATQPVAARSFSLALNPWELAFQPVLRSLDNPSGSGGSGWFERGGTHGDDPLVIQVLPTWHPPRSAWGLALPVYWRSIKDQDFQVLLTDVRVQWYTPGSNRKGYLLAGVRRTWEAGRLQDDHRRVQLNRFGGFVGSGIEFSSGRFFASFAVMAGMYGGPEPPDLAGHNLQGSKVLFHVEPLLLGIRF